MTLGKFFPPSLILSSLICKLIIIIAPISYALLVRSKWTKADRAYGTVPGTYQVLSIWKLLLFMSLLLVRTSALGEDRVALHIEEGRDHIK